MFQQWKEKWGVGWGRFILIFATFALGGSLCGFAGRKLLRLANLEHMPLPVYVVVYMIMITVLWPLCVLVMSVPMGQFVFFRKYLYRIGSRMKNKPWKQQHVHQKSIAIFASGAGSNAEKIIRYLKGHASIRVSLVVCNKQDAGVCEIARAYGIPVLIVHKETFFHGDAYLQELRRYGIDFIVLAGFLWKVPAALVQAYPNRIINIHPALLPKYGGKGMYGMKVHEAVIAAGEKKSGITIHYVNERFDDGPVIFQASCVVGPEDTPDSLAAKIHTLEHRHFPVVIEKTISSLHF